MMIKTKHKFAFLFPIIFALGFIPVLVHSHVYNTNLSQFEWFADSSNVQVDFFLYYKMIAIILVATIMTIMLVKLYVDKKHFEMNGAFYCLLAYAVLSLLSALFSTYRYFSFHGNYEVFESIWVILGYVIFAFYTYQIIQDETDVMVVFKYAVIGVLIVSFIGAFQYLGFDLFRSTIGKMLITSPSEWSQLDTLSFTFPLKTSYTTLYNTNYLPFYFGMFLPIAILLIMFEKNMKARCVYILLSALFIFNIIGSNSKSGLIAVGIAIALGCILFVKQILKKKWMIPLMAGAFVLLIAIFAIRHGGISGLASLIFHGYEGVADEYTLKDIDTNDDDVTIFYKDSELHVAYELINDGQEVMVYLSDKGGNEINYTLLDDNVTRVVDGNEFGYCTVRPIYIDELIGVEVHIDDKDWYFTNQTDGTYYYYNACGKYVKIKDHEIANLFPNSFFSGRGHLWNKLVPTLKNYVILGIGTNNFLFAYPQDDYVERANTNTMYVYDVKAHNLYLQQFVENGFLALIAFLAFYICYFISSFKLYFKRNEYTRLSIIGAGILLGTVIYMILGLANDSNVNTAPVFWIMIGMGLAINRIVKSQE